MRPLHGVVWLLLAAAPAAADVVTDGTVGPRASLSGDFEIGAGLGTRAGRNLFHSFERFSLRPGERATFSGPAAIRNVISRVTGGVRSDIDGTIASTIPGADLYLINPAGVLFGPDARLDLPGSFHVSTADEVRFAGGAVFSAADPAISSFTVAAPEGFGFLGTDGRAPILVDRSRLAVPDGEALSLVGGDITIRGDPAAASSGGPGTLLAGAGTVTLAAAAGPAELDLASGALDAGRRADIRLRDQALVAASGNGGGTVRIRGGTLEVADRSFVVANNDGALDAPGGIDVAADRVRVAGGSALRANALGSGRGGDLQIDAAELRLRDASGIGGAVGGRGDGGAVRVVAGSLEILDGGQLGSVSFGAGHAGTVLVQADRLLIRAGGSEQPTGIVSDALAGSGNAGALRVVARDLQIRGGGVVGSAAGAGSSGHAGDVQIAAGELKILDGGAIRSITFGAGDAGEVAIEAGRIELLSGGSITNATFGTGAAGRVAVAADRLLIRRGGSGVFTGIASDAGPGSSGQGGLVQIAAGELKILDGGELRADTRGGGDAGGVAIEAGRVTILAGGSVTSATFSDGAGGRVSIAADQVLIRGGQSAPFTGVTSSAQAGSVGKAGAVRIVAGELAILAGGEISSGTFGEGEGGRVMVAADRLLIRGGGSAFFTGITSGADVGFSGPAGAVRVVAGELEILSGGAIDSVTFGEAPAGTVTVEADRLLIRGDGSAFFTGISSSAATNTVGAVGQGDAGRVRIRARTVQLADGGGIRSSADGRGTAGDVTLRVEDRLIVDDASIATVTALAGGGAIRLLVGNLIDLRDSAVTTSVAGGQDPTAGNIIIDPAILIIDGSRIQANAPVGFGGNVTIVADNILVPGGDFAALLARGEISASGGDPSRAGSVLVNAPEVDLAGGLVVLEGAVVNAAPLRARCATRRDVGTSSFTGVGRAGLAASPDGPLAGAYHDAKAALRTGARAALAQAVAALPCAPARRVGSAGRDR